MSGEAKKTGCADDMGEVGGMDPSGLGTQESGCMEAQASMGVDPDNEVFDAVATEYLASRGEVPSVLPDPSAYCHDSEEGDSTNLVSGVTGFAAAGKPRSANVFRDDLRHPRALGVFDSPSAIEVRKGAKRKGDLNLSLA